ncbi:MAG TPA: phosphomannomutase/phosphoglucomutase [Alphaproteobacteria bacterium]|nr:phosphomannomutase/phosphoglucomutase [Alphaproteobacteria bacterium]
MTAHRFEPTILREYDIRGIVGKTLHPADAYAIGRALATVVAKKGGSHVHVGRDGRVSSIDMEKAVCEGLAAGGMKVTRVGLGPTPMLYYATFSRGSDAGLMVTGSHNPSDYNGFKMVLNKKAFYGDDILNLGKIAASGDYVSGKGSIGDEAVFDDYIARLMKDFAPGKELRVAWDAGNGSAGPAMVELTKRLPGKHFLLYENVDGNFPNHHPDPTVAKNLVDLQALVKKEKCDLGIAFDGDGDRIGVVDGQGRILWGDQLMAIWSRDVLKNKPGATIIADVKASQVLFDEVAKLGGKPLMWKTGHSLIKSKMAEVSSPLAGEMSGHIFFADKYYGYDDAPYAAVRLLSIVGNAKESLADMRDSMPQMINTPEVRFQCDDTRKFAVAEEVKARLVKAGANFNDCDGVRVNTKDGWWLLRASNTQDVLVARCEAFDEAGLERLKDDLFAQLGQSGINPPRMDDGGH